MKKPLSLFLIIAFVLTASAQNYVSFNGSVSKNAIDTEPQISITDISNGKRVSISFPGAKVKNDKQFTNCKRLFIPGCAEESHIGMPAVLYFKKTFDLEQGTQPEIKNLTTEYNTLNIRLAPSEYLYKDSENETKERKAILNPAIQYPSKEYSLNYDGRYFDRDLYTLKINVTKYLNDSTIAALRNITFDIVDSKEVNTEKFNYAKMSKLSEGPKISSGARALLRSFSTGVTLPDTIESGMMSADNSDYVIVTHDSLLEDIEDFVEWKRCTGHNVKVFSSGNWTPSEIKSTVSNFCNDYFSTSYQYLLIIGDISNVPSNLHEFQLPGEYYFTQYYTDMPYACINGDLDSIPDLIYARITSSSPQQTKSVLNKIIEYEKKPTVDENFYKNVTHAAYFQDDDLPLISKRDGYEDRFFVEGSEEMRSLAIAKGKTVNRIYKALDSVNPLYWGDKGKGGNIPTELLRPNFSWNGSPQDVVDKINQGSMYVIYRGHGGSDRWGNIPFGTTHINSLSNGKKLPFLFSTTCMTGAFQEENCFASNFILAENKGGIGAIGASQRSFTYPNDALASALLYAFLGKSHQDASFFTFRPSAINFNGKPDNHHAIGKVFAFAKRSMGNYLDDKDCLNYQNEIYHLFGDPGMMLYTQKPDTINYADVKVSYTEDNIEVEAPRIGYISFYNTKTKIVQRYYGRSHKFYHRNLNSSDYVIGVQLYNHVPFVKKPYQSPVIVGPVTPIEPPIVSELSSLFLDQTGQNAKVNYIIAPEAKNANIQITSIAGEVKRIITIDKSDTNATIDFSGLPKGTYIVTLIVDETNCGNKNIRI